MTPLATKHSPLLAAKTKTSEPTIATCQRTSRFSSRSNTSPCDAGPSSKPCGRCPKAGERWKHRVPQKWSTDYYSSTSSFKVLKPSTHQNLTVETRSLRKKYIQYRYPSNLFRTFRIFCRSSLRSLFSALPLSHVASNRRLGGEPPPRFQRKDA